MEWRSWENLPKKMRKSEVKEYYDIISEKRKSLTVKRGFDIFTSSVMILLLFPVMAVIAVMIKLDSKGPVLFLQTRVTQYGRNFKILKFRTMVEHADKLGSQVTTKNDMRVTKMGKVLRKYRLDELPQLFNILMGDMTFVGTRPEVPKYVAEYSEEMLATLLLPAGVTSEASILYKDEERLLENAEDADEVYVREVLPAKMTYNLESIRRFSLVRELLTMIRTVIAVVK